MSDVTEQAVAAIADLADAMAGIRVLFEQEFERYAAERAEDADEKARKDPIRREAALQELRDQLRGAVHEAVTGDPAIFPDGVGPVTLPAEMEHRLADQLVTALAKRLSSWGLRDACRTLGAANPPESLTDIARSRARAELGASATEVDVERWMNTWLAGALYHERG